MGAEKAAEQAKKAAEKKAEEAKKAEEKAAEEKKKAEEKKAAAEKAAEEKKKADEKATTPKPKTYGAQQKQKQCYVNGDKAVHHGDRLDNPVFGGGGFIGTLTLDDCKARCNTDKGPKGRPCVAIEFSDGGGASTGKRSCALLWGCDYVKDWSGGS